MLIENKGIKTETFYIPPFELNEGEIVVLHLFNGAHFYETEMFLKDIFSGKIENENVLIHQKLTFVEHFFEPKFRRIFYPVTVKEYLKKNSDLSNTYSAKIYENKWITEKTKVNTLAGTPRKLLSLYATLSKTSNMILDLAGQDPEGADKIFEIVDDAVKNGGAAIFLDCFDDLKNHAVKYIELQWLK